MNWKWSNKTKQWLKDEKNIIWLYENKLDSKVSETGFVISQRYPFLGTSPDGEVDGGLLEIKISKEAVCKYGIQVCREGSHVSGSTRIYQV